MRNCSSGGGAGGGRGQLRLRGGFQELQACFVDGRRRGRLLQAYERWLLDQFQHAFHQRQGFPGRLGKALPRDHERLVKILAIDPGMAAHARLQPVVPHP